MRNHKRYDKVLESLRDGHITAFAVEYGHRTRLYSAAKRLGFEITVELTDKLGPDKANEWFATAKKL